MLSDHERRTLRQIQADLVASDPELAQVLASNDRGLLGLRRAYLVWVVAASASLLMLLALAIGWASGAFLFASVVLGALVCLLWWPQTRIGHLRRRSSQ